MNMCCTDAIFFLCMPKKLEGTLIPTGPSLKNFKNISALVDSSGTAKTLYTSLPLTATYGTSN